MFAERFWTVNYSDGFETLFTKLLQGCAENEEILALANARALAEASYGEQLRDIPLNLPESKKGFGRDDGATLRRSYEGMVDEMSREGMRHIQVADNIRNMIIEPFGKWTIAHQKRVEYSHSLLRKKVKQYQREVVEVERSQKRYFNRCRVEEDASSAQEESKYDSDAAVPSTPAPESAEPAAAGAAADDSQDNASTSTAATSATAEPPAVITSEELVLAGKHFSSDEAQSVVAHMLQEIPQKDVRVAILGTYENCSTGAEIVAWLQEHTELTAVSSAEQAGQDMIGAGLLRLVGQVGSRFANSSVMHYQWRPKAWAFAGLRHDGSAFSGMVTDLTQGLTERWGSTHRGEDSNGGSVTIKELDQRYRKNVSILDNVRCEFEETAVEHLRFMERCERDRLSAVKAVMLDLCAAISNVVPSIQASMDQLLLFQETADPLRDLRYAVETYQTGPFQPRVAVYDNYYSSADGSTVFGTDIELRSRGDRKPVPSVVSSLLSYLDMRYPTMENDKERLDAWGNASNDMALLTAVHALRRELNNLSRPEQFRQVLTKLEPTPAVAVSTLHLYFLELPESLLPPQYYEVLKGVYQKYTGSSDEDRTARVTAVQNALSQLRISHIATLDALTAHLKRLVTIANAQPADITRLCQRWGPAISRPRLPSAVALDDAHTAIVLEDLISQRDNVFRELKRLAQPSAGPSRLPSVVSTSGRAKSYLNSVSASSAPRSRSSTLSKSAVQSRSSSSSSPVPPLQIPVAEEPREATDVSA